MSSNGGGNDADPFAWLGLLKWSLNYVDGTKPSGESAVPMSDEDRAFLEDVMKNGIVDEGDRMKFILREATRTVEFYVGAKERSADGEEKEEATESLLELLEELRDIVEQIDYARAFCSMKGLPFLLGCIAERRVPPALRAACTGVLSTLAQNNAHVQKEMLELGALKVLSDAFFSDDASPSLKSKLVQATSSAVRNNPLAESVFCSLGQAPALVMEGLRDGQGKALRSRTLFFLKALLTSDESTAERVAIFRGTVVRAADRYLLAGGGGGDDDDLREMTASMMEQLVGRDLLGEDVLPSDRKDALVGAAVRHIARIRALEGDEKEFAQVELEHWEGLLVALARR